MSVTHIAGPPVMIAGRLVQRCLWCGEKLLDSRGSMGPVGPDGVAPKFPVWGAGRLIQIDGNRALDVGALDEVESLPPDFCTDLVE